ncbi:MAG: hypothetical protein V1760_03690, partial [Candidatus Peregrinibacteria bacterium]
SEEKTGEPQATDKDYLNIIRSDVPLDSHYIKDTGIPAKIVYYCPECEKLIAPKRIGKKFRFSCQECKCDAVAFGTEESIGNYYRIPGLFKKEKKPSLD